MEPKPISFYEKLLADFERERPEVFHLRSLVGIEASLSEKDQTITILWGGSEEFDEETSPRSIPNLMSRFSANVDGQSFEVTILEEASDEFQANSTEIASELSEFSPVRALVDVGTSARGVGLGGTGTFGWGFALDGQLSALSNWHVFCPNGNSTPLGLPVEIDGRRIASLSQYDQVPNHAAKWDFAVARFDPGSGYRPQFRVCDSGAGVRMPYPFRLASALSPLPIGDMFYSVGNRSPVCGDGRLKGVVNPSVRYNDGRVVRFSSQLAFEKMTDRGDSGSVAVQKSSTDIWGLMFAGSSSRSLANPLYQKNWVYRGRSYVGPFGDEQEMFEVPSFETDSSGNEDGVTEFRADREDQEALSNELLAGSAPPLSQGGGPAVLFSGRLSNAVISQKIPWKRNPDWMWVEFRYSYRDTSGRHPRTVSVNGGGYIHFAAPNYVWPGKKP